MGLYLLVLVALAPLFDADNLLSGFGQCVSSSFSVALLGCPHQGIPILTLYSYKIENVFLDKNRFVQRLRDYCFIVPLNYISRQRPSGNSLAELNDGRGRQSQNVNNFSRLIFMKFFEKSINSSLKCFVSGKIEEKVRPLINFTIVCLLDHS